MRQVLSWALARSPGREPGMRALAAFCEAALVPPRYGVRIASLPRSPNRQHDQASGGQGLDDAPDPGCGQVMHGAGQRPGHPHDVPRRDWR